MSSCEIIRFPRAKGRVRIAGPSSAHSNVQKSTAHHDGAVVQAFGLVSEEKVREAFEQGIEEGSRRTTELLQDQYSERITEETVRIRQVLSSIEQALSTQSVATEQALFEFAVGVAEQIIRREVTLDRTILLTMMQDAVRKIVGVERVVVRVHPSDLNYIQENRHAVQSASEALREITFEGDASIDPGGCTVESDIGNVDARIATQLDQVKELIGKHS